MAGYISGAGTRIRPKHNVRSALVTVLLRIFHGEKELMELSGRVTIFDIGAKHSSRI